MTALGRIEPPDWEHVEKYPLRSLAAPPVGVPVVIGINWYSNFDRPESVMSLNNWRHEYHIGRGDLGSIRGGHCVCLEPNVKPEKRDNPHWWDYYNQGEEGACTGFGASRAMSLLNRRRYQAFWLYRQAQALGKLPSNSEGAYVRDAMEVLRTLGHVRDSRPSHLEMADEELSDDRPYVQDGISAFRWATTVEEVLEALAAPGADTVTLLNSWGTAYPHRTKLSVDVLSRLLGEGGEAAIVTDR